MVAQTKQSQCNLGDETFPQEFYMGSKKPTTICGTRGILNIKAGGSSAKSDKAVTIVEPESVRQKRVEKETQRIQQYKDVVDELIYEQIRKRRKEFVKLKGDADFQR